MNPLLRLREALTLGGLSPKEAALRTWKRVNDHEIMTRAAAVSFYAMLALVPFLALILTLIARLLPDLTGRKSGLGNLTADELRTTLRTAFPPEAYEVIENQIARLQHEDSTSVVWVVIGLGVTLWLASSLFVAVIDAMNRIYGVAETRSFVRLRVTAVVMTCVEAVMLVGSLLVIVLWPQILAWLGMKAGAALFATVVQWVVVYFMVLFTFALTFYVGPDADQRWEWITPGSLVGAALFLAASFGFRVYVQYFANYNQSYGSLGGVMVLLFWFWISSLVLLASAQTNKVVEEASPLGKNFGQKVDSTEAPDFKAMKPEPASE